MFTVFFHGLELNLNDLQGLAIGNGLTDPEIQYKAYTDFAFYVGLINKTDYERINMILPGCEDAIKLCGNLCVPLHNCLHGIG